MIAGVVTSAGNTVSRVVPAPAPPAPPAPEAPAALASAPAPPSEPSPFPEAQARETDNIKSVEEKNGDLLMGTNLVLLTLGHSDNTDLLSFLPIVAVTAMQQSVWIETAGTGAA